MSPLKMIQNFIKEKSEEFKINTTLPLMNSIKAKLKLDASKSINSNMNFFINKLMRLSLTRIGKILKLINSNQLMNISNCFYNKKQLRIRIILMKELISCKKLQNGKINFNKMFKKLKEIYKMKE